MCHATSNCWAGANSVEAVIERVRDILAEKVDDGVRFDPNPVLGREIIAEAAYVGARITLSADLSGMLLKMQIDVGFGDAVVAAPTWVLYPQLLDRGAPRLSAIQRKRRWLRSCTRWLCSASRTVGSRTTTTCGPRDSWASRLRLASGKRFATRFPDEEKQSQRGCQKDSNGCFPRSDRSKPSGPDS